jgi:hypothetical protein
MENTTKLKLFFLIKGPFSFEVIEDLLTQFKNYIAQSSVDIVVKKRLFSIMVESMENSYRHKINLNGSGNHSPVEFLLKQTEKGFIINIGNYVPNDSITTLLKEYIR